MSEGPEKKPVEWMGSQDKLLCPECTGIINAEHIGAAEIDEIECPHCSAVIRLPRIGKQGVNEGNARRDRRCPIKLKVTYPSAQEFQADYTSNISRGGMFISTENPPPIGTMVDINLHLPSLVDPINLTGEVVHSHRPGEGEGGPGLGLKFIDIDAVSRGTLASYLLYLSDCA